jgi:putative aldouronate transport system permease protein
LKRGDFIEIIKSVEENEKEGIKIETTTRISTGQRTRTKRAVAYIKRYWMLYIFLLPGIADVLIFRYIPMYGLQIAFKDYKVRYGIWGSQWVGLLHFQRFIETVNFWQIIRNTVMISVTSLIFGFPVPIILAFMIHELRSNSYRKFVQMITYMPHFISMVAIVGLIKLFTERSTGLINLLRINMGYEGISFMTEPSAFIPIYVISGIWQEAGWGTIIYLAALAGIDVDMLDAAEVDGVTRFQRILYLYFPTILPTIIILMILNVGSILNVGFEKVFLMQNDLNLEVSEVISTYVYRWGLLNGRYSYTTAIGLFNSVVNCILLVVVNQISRRVSHTSLW